jgi:hypothetical protein
VFVGLLLPFEVVLLHLLLHGLEALVLEDRGLDERGLGLGGGLLQGLVLDSGDLILKELL